MILQLPTKNDEVQEYNQEFGVKLPMPVNVMSKQSIVNHFFFVRDWFYDPHSDRDDINHYNFKEEFLNVDHLIIDFNLRNVKTSKERARALCGFILQELRQIQDRTKACYFIEECRELLPNINVDQGDYMMPSSVKEIYDLMTLDPKFSSSIFLIMQSEKMIYKNVLDHFFIRIMGRDAILEHRSDVMETMKKMNLKWIPNLGIREFMYWDRTGKMFKYTPLICACRC